MLADHNLVGSNNITCPDRFLNRRYLSCLYTNARGYLNKFSEMELRCKTNPFDIVAITETWLTIDILDSELGLSGMSLLRCDRLTRGGGVLLYHRNNLHCELLDIPDAAPDSLWCSLRLSKNDRCLIGVVYRPPASPDAANEILLQTMSNALSLKFTHVIIMGDFNCPNLVRKKTSHQPFERQLTQFIGLHPLYNHVTEPTRFEAGHNPSTLDLVLTNEELMVESVNITTPIGRSDHAVLEFDYICYASTQENGKSNTRAIIDYKKLQNLAALKQWVLPEDDQDPLVAWKSFTDHLTEIITDATSIKTCTQSKTRQSFLRSRTKKWMEKRDFYWREYRRCPSIEAWNNYSLTRNKCTEFVREDKLTFQETMAQKFIVNPKMLYKHINSTRKVKFGIPALRSFGHVSTTTLEAAEFLKAQFDQVFTATSNIELQIPSIQHCIPYPSLVNMTFTGEMVRAKLLTLRKNSSPGADNIHPRTLISLAHDISEPLAVLYQRMFNKSVIPQSWKEGVISPIYKGGSRSDPANYRPVTLLPILSKVMEANVADLLMEYLEKHELLSPFQHGFRNKRSCTTNLLLARDQWTKSVDVGEPLDIVYLDFSKAFDRVNHQILLQKLYNYGVRGLVIDWIKEFLQQRTMSVRVGDSLSEPITPARGVPQGSVLGPRLFLAFINDLPQVLGHNVLLFADDAKIWRTVTHTDDHIALQQTIDAAYRWSIANDIEFNVSKCKVISMRHKTRFSYVLGNQILPHATEERDLGVMVQEDVGCSRQSAKASSMALKQVGLLKRAFGQFERKLFPRLLSGFVRPHTEYAVQVWNPWLKRDKKALERPQRLATKLVKGLKNKTYPERLKILGLYSSQYRRLRGDLILTYHILHQPNHPCRSMLTLSRNDQLRGHPLKLITPKSRLDCRHNSFAVRVCGIWNSLPSHVVCAPTVELFKSHLDKVLKHLTFQH